MEISLFIVEILVSLKSTKDKKTTKRDNTKTRAALKLFEVSKLKVPVLMVNSYMKDGAEAVGGAYLFSKGEIKNTLPLGSIGEIIIHFNEKRRRIK